MDALTLASVASSPLFVGGVALLSLLGFFVLWLQRRKKQRGLAYASVEEDFGSKVPRARKEHAATLLLLAGVFLATLGAMVRIEQDLAQTPFGEQGSMRHAALTIVVLDYSASMEETQRPSKWELSKKVLGRALAARSGAAVGLVLFADGAFEVLAPTKDVTLFYPVLRWPQPDSKTYPGRAVNRTMEMGTQIGEGLALAQQIIAREKIAPQRAEVLLISDLEEYETRELFERSRRLIREIALRGSAVTVFGIRSDKPDLAFFQEAGSALARYTVLGIYTEEDLEAVGRQSVLEVMENTPGVSGENIESLGSRKGFGEVRQVLGMFAFAAWIVLLMRVEIFHPRAIELEERIWFGRK